MNEKDFKNSYKEDLSGLHAPTDLIEKTKQMAAFEEKRYQKEKKKTYYFASFATVAALLVICFSVYFLSRPVQPVEEGEYGTTIHLGNKDGGKEIVLDEQVEVNRVTILPMEFNGKDCIRQEVDDTDVMITLLDEQYYMGAFEEEDSYIVVKSGITDEEEFVKLMQEILAEYED